MILTLKAKGLVLLQENLWLTVDVESDRGGGALVLDAQMAVPCGADLDDVAAEAREKCGRPWEIEKVEFGVGGAETLRFKRLLSVNGALNQEARRALFLAWADDWRPTHVLFLDWQVGTEVVLLGHRPGEEMIGGRLWLYTPFEYVLGVAGASLTWQENERRVEYRGLHGGYVELLI